MKRRTILLIGLIFLLEKKVKTKEILFIGMLLNIVYKISYICTENFYLERLNLFEGAFTFPCVTGIAKYFFQGNELEQIVEKIFISVFIFICFLIMCIILLNLSKKKKWVIQLLVLGCISTVQINDSQVVIGKMRHYVNQRYEDVDDIAKSIDCDWDEKENVEIYYYSTNAANDIQANILALQLKIGKTPISKISDLDDMTYKSMRKYIILNKSEEDYQC